MPPKNSITRRRLLASASVGAAAVGLGGGGFLAGRESADTLAEKLSQVPAQIDNG